jgi:nucleoside-diphosphate-sugar epimerase
METILGAGGVIGRELSILLGREGRPVRQVSRDPRAVNPGDELVPADLLEAAAVDRAVAGSEVAYLVAGLPYDARIWARDWPRIMDNVIGACGRHGARLVFFDNVYAYGRVEGPMTESTPYNPCSRKGEVRARIATTLEEAMAAGQVEALIVRSADFYGPGALASFPHATVVERLRKGRPPQWIGNPEAVHTFTYTPDAARSVAVLGKTPSAFGQTWHALTHPDPLTGEGFVRLACEAAGEPFRIQVAPRWLLRIMGLMNPVLRENDEMMYQFEADYRFDSTKLARAFGVEATGYPEGIRETLAASRGGGG